MEGVTIQPVSMGAGWMDRGYHLLACLVGGVGSTITSPKSLVHMEFLAYNYEEIWVTEF